MGLKGGLVALWYFEHWLLPCQRTKIFGDIYHAELKQRYTRAQDASNYRPLVVGFQICACLPRKGSGGLGWSLTIG